MNEVTIADTDTKMDKSNNESVRELAKVFDRGNNWFDTFLSMAKYNNFDRIYLFVFDTATKLDPFLRVVLDDMNKHYESDPTLFAQAQTDPSIQIARKEFEGAVAHNEKGSKKDSKK